MAIPVYGGVSMNSLTRRMVKVIETYYPEHREVYVTSAIRSGSGSYHNGINYNGSTGYAIDLGAYDDSEPNSKDQRDMGLLADWLWNNFWDLTIELIHTQPHNDHYTYVKNQRKVGAYATSTHVNHIHWATNSRLMSQIESRARSKWGSGNSSGGSGSTTKDVNYYRMRPYDRRPKLERGDSGPAVGYLQKLLRDATGADIDDLPDDNYPFGPQTEDAMLDFQEWTDVTEDGKVTDKDWERLEELLGIQPGGKPTIERGDSSRWTGYVQHVLRKYEDLTIDKVQGFPFGPQTEDAVETFQRREGLTIDGVVGDDTWGAIDEVTKAKLDAAHLRKNPPPEPEPEPEPDTILFGWDASDFDWDRGARPANVEAAYDEGIRFFTHKISEMAADGEWVHERCGVMLQAAVNVGVPFIGAYIVVRTPGPSITEQVQFAIDNLDAQWPDWGQAEGFFWQVDLEKWSYDEVDAEHGVEMCAKLREMTNRAAILYAPRWAYGNTIPGDDFLWNSDYRGSGASRPFKTQWEDVRRSDTNQGYEPMSGRVPVILQYASDAVIGGQSPCDANVFLGTLTGFDEMIERPTPEEEPEPEPEVSPLDSAIELAESLLTELETLKEEL